MAVNLVKTGTGTQKLLGSNSIRGNTTIQQGTLVKQWSDLADTGSLMIAAGAKLHLLQDAEDVVSALIVDGVSKPPGLYGALSSANPNDTEIPFITGVGRIRIVPVPVAFAQWALSHGLTGSNATYAADPDGDRSTNLAEFALGGNPVLSGNVPAAYASVAAINGYNSLTYTFLVRNGAVVSYDGNDALLKVDGITYHIQGSRDLIGFNVRVDITPVRPGPVAAPAGYQYITFFIPGTYAAPQGYMRAWISVP